MSSQQLYGNEDRREDLSQADAANLPARGGTDEVGLDPSQADAANLPARGGNGVVGEDPPQADASKFSARGGTNAVGENPAQADASQLSATGGSGVVGEDLPQADASKLSSRGGTDVVGEPVNPLRDPAGADLPTATSRAPPVSPYESRPANGPGNFPTSQKPQSLSSTPVDQPGVSSPYVQTAAASGAQPGVSSGAPPGASSYVQTPSGPGVTNKSPMDSIIEVFNKWSKKAEDMTGNVWHHLRTGPNVADTAFGRLSVGTRLMTGGGVENVYRQTFEVAPDERLLKTFACYLSTSTGPLAGTLFISSVKLAFCSDRPLAMPGSNSANSPNAGATAAPSSESASAQQNEASAKQQEASAQQQQKQEMHYYKVVVPISQIESVNPSENTVKKVTEKYVQVKTKDGHEFWFMGFVNYDKGVKNLQETLQPKITPDTNTASNVDTNASSNVDTNTGSNVDTNTAYNVDNNTASNVVN